MAMAFILIGGISGLNLKFAIRVDAIVLVTAQDAPRVRQVRRQESLNLG
ncbi:hypothetical protein APED_13030 [Acanthopleuribacter pedis]